MPVSCVTGAGERPLRDALAAAVAGEVVDLGGRVAISERHRAALEAAARALSGADFGAPEIAAEAVRVALESVRDVLGEVTTEDVLDRIFAEFCLGK
jgi:tRNA modification GTPase